MIMHTLCKSNLHWGASEADGAPIMAGGTFDLKRQREALEQLRREVDALDGGPSSAPQTSSTLLTKEAPRKVVAPAAARVDEHLEASIAELSAKTQVLATETEAAKAELSQREAIQAQAKAEWSRALSHAVSAEGREERRLVAARRESEEMRSEGLQNEAVHRFDCDRLRQRQRNLRMQFRQAEKQCLETAQEEAMGCEFNGNEDQREAAYFRASDLGASTTASSSALPRGAAVRARGTARSHSPAGKRQMVPAISKVSSALRDLEAAKANISQLEQRQEELSRGQRELSAREAELRKASRISNREVQHLRRRSELKAEEAGLREEQDELRAQLHAIGSEARDAQREAARQRGSQEHFAQELGVREAHFHEQETSAMQALGTIDEYLAANCSSLSGDEQQAHLAEWLEADISTRQVERLKRRLSELVADAGARAQVLEQAVAELHADLDRRAAIILELVERRGASTQFDCVSGTFGDAGCESSSEDQDAPTAAEKAAEGESTGRDGPEASATAQVELEKQALEDELEHQRGLFELRGEQVQGLEQRLAALLAREAPRVYALRAWVAVHEALSRERLQACLVAAASSTSLRADVEAMQRDKSVCLAKAEAEWNAERYRISEAANEARHCADGAAAHAAAVLRRRTGLLRSLDKTLKAESKLGGRISIACDAVDRDQRRLVDLTARQIRASSAMAQQRSGEKVKGTERGEAARQALQDARELVEATRVQQAEALLGLVQENKQVGNELRRVEEALEKEILQEERARLELCEVEAQANVRPSSDGGAQIGFPARTASTSSPRRRQGGAVSSDKPAAPNSLAPKRQGLERRRTKLEEDLLATSEQLRRGEAKLEEAETAQRRLGQKAEAKVEEMEQEYESERTKQRTIVAGVLRRYRTAQSSYAEGESAHTDLCSRSDALGQELSDARSALCRAREKRQKQKQKPQQQSDRKMTGSTSTNVTSVGGNGTSEQQVSQSNGRSQHQVTLPTASIASKTFSINTGPTLSRTIPSILEIQQRVDMEGHPEMHSFYLQVLPLLRGTSIEVFRRSSQRFELRQLVLSSDFQRLEIWSPNSTPATSSTATLSASSSSLTALSSRSRPRLAESFLRIEGMVRVHVPKATLSTVQRAILSATSASDPQDCSSGDGSSRGLMAAAGADSQFEEDSTKGAGETHCTNGSVGATQRSTSATRINGPASKSGSRQAFPFELVMDCSEPWKLSVSDVHTFHLATQAIGALLASRASLPTYAIALSLGVASQQAQAAARSV
jgi:hypothetical protein